MEDDIDIEEHDVLDNPRIKSIFPDLAKVKIEVPDEDVQDDYNETDEPQDPELLYQYEYEFETDNSQESYDNTEHIQTNENFYNNEIILGSKPSYDYETLFNEAMQSNTCVYLENWESKLFTNPCYCQDCAILFPTVNALDAHKMIKHSYLIALDTRPNTARKSTVHSKYCNHCDRTFPDDTALIKHLYELLPLNNFEPNPIKQDEKPISEKPIPKMVKIRKEKPKYICTKCFKTFFGYKEAQRHKKASHGDIPKKMHIIKTIKKMQLPTSHYIKKFATMKLEGPNSHSSKKFFSNSLVSKALYQCYICNTNFLSCYAAMCHSKLCAKKKSDTGFKKCGYCKRKIKNRDVKLHGLQHRYVDKIKIYTINRNMYEKVLCKCPKCCIYFDEIGFWSHSNICGNATYQKCTYCNIKIDAKKFVTHLEYHTAKKMTVNDFIFIEYLTIESDTINDSVDGVGNDRFLYFCHHCGCCQHRVAKKGHIDKTCKGKSRKMCNICGLYFTTKTIVKHVALHSETNWSLKDFKIMNLFTRKPIEPPMPNYYICYVCNVYFPSLYMKKCHKCKEISVKFCQICNKNFTLDLFKVHMNFHDRQNEIPIPMLLKKYNSIENMWNVLFKCQRCDLVTSDYDTVIEHCQKHINKIQDVLEICEICDFEFVESCYKNHEILHENNEDLDSNSFKILKYDYNDLFKNNWEEFLKDLPVEHKTQIMAKSLYKYTRSFRLHNTQSSNAVPPLGYCMRCHKSVPPELMLKHVNCSPNTKFPCNMCTQTFNTHNNLISHQTKQHNERKNSLVTFNHPEDEEFNKKLQLFQQKTREEYREPSSSGIVKNVKAKPQKPVEDSSNVPQTDDLKQFDLRKYRWNRNLKPLYKIGKLSMKQRYRYKSILYQNVLKLYKCFRCKCCSIYKRSVETHGVCVGKEPKQLCNICNEYFNKRFYEHHQNIHVMFPKLNQNSIEIVFYAKGRILQVNKNKNSTENIKEKSGKPNNKKLVPKIKNVSSENKAISKVKKLPPVKNDTTKVVPDNDKTNKTAYLYKCQCGLHYTSKKSVEKHAAICDKNLEISKEICSKCDLLFPTEVLVTHLCNHHSKSIKIDIIKVRIAILIKCSVCSIYYSCKSDYESHICFPDKVQKCDKCNYTFTAGAFGRHPCSNKYTLCVYKIISEERTVFVYRCTKCDICYSSRHSYTYHIDVNHKCHLEVIPCDVCGLNFTKMSLSKHLPMHRGGDTYKICLVDADTDQKTYLTGDNMVKKRKYNDTDAKTSKNDANKRRKVKSDVSESDLTDVSMTNSRIEDTDTKSDSMSDHNSITVDKSDCKDMTDVQNIRVISKGSNNNILYKCTDCELHYLKDTSLYYHLTTHDHIKDPVYYPCDICGLNFAKYSISRHVKIHHTLMQLKRGQFMINLSYCISQGTINSSRDAEKPLSSTEKSDKNANPDINVSSDNIEHSQEAMNIDSQNDSDISDQSDAENIVESRKTRSTEKKKASEKLRKSYSDRTNKKSKSSPEVSKSNTKTSVVSEKSDTVETDTQNPSDSKTDKILYHKCALCNVYFLNKSDCLDHLTDHETLDPISYINCKICNFQFLIENLKEHISVQHKTAFCLDDIIINEYSPASMAKNAYDTVNKVQSGLISTTTETFA